MKTLDYNRRILLALSLMVLAACATVGPQPDARAEASYPNRPVRIVLPFAAGGVADTTARIIAEKLGDKLGQRFYVENQPGAGGIAAARTVISSTPDGYTLALLTNGTAISVSLFAKLPFDPLKDFAPISSLGFFDFIFCTAAATDFKTLADFIAAARAKPGALNVGTINIGSTQNLAAELFKSTAGISAQVVPFNGTPAVTTALRGGEVDAAIEILGPVKSQITSKALRALAVLGEKRPTGLPEVPTASETGGALKGFNVSSWNALAAPAGTPREVIARLNRELQAALAQPGLKQQLADVNVDARASTPEQLGALLASETKRWSDVIAQAKIPRQ